MPEPPGPTRDSNLTPGRRVRSDSSRSSRPMSGRTTVGRFVGAARAGSALRRWTGVGARTGTATSACAPSASSWRSTRSCSDRKVTDGSRPKSSSRMCAGPGVHLERIGLSTATVESNHQQTRQGLEGGVVADDGIEVVHHLVVTPQGERGLCAFGERGDAQRGEPCSLADGPLLGVEVAEGLSPPQLERGVVRRQMGLEDVDPDVVTGGRRGGGTCEADPVGEVDRVHRLRVDVRAVAHAFTRDQLPACGSPSGCGAAWRPGSAGHSSDRLAGSTPPTAGR